ncbi:MULTISPECIES: SigE family RNA polymerase sigma factor [Kitasatospora]|uniref:Putative RNA polymerase ECF subfamily sigma factor n=1 Tax=Kitasatospora setae (strain ATCC 33774 / DSM 43861 / JCM 3304 / KCC A-0304 / NBRC 14216 / KM-6054) TaxID=452652 RepID=E4N0A4_KITSK|nr:SigE family RNA polymerase sigma factor [Kitasatospora setae]BAJ31432.1 putative RNA polymerase ECF subfamily sigma factor [Kitasatospora setae KM-6054]
MAAKEVQGGDAEYAEFATSRSGHLYRSACLLTGGDTHLAEDLVQETLSRMYTAWRRPGWLFGGRTIENPAGYAQGILYRQFISHRRRRSAGERPIAQVPDRAGPESDSTLRVTLLEALGALPPRDRAVLVLRYWEDVSVEETAEILRCGPGAVRTRTSRALVRLRALLGDSLPDLVQR